MTKGVFGKKVESVTPLKAFQQLGRREEILELLSEGFCARCKGLLQSRLENLSNGNFDMLSSSNGKWSESSSVACSMDSLSLDSPDETSTSSRMKPHLHEDTAQSSAQAPEPISSARHWINYSDSLPALVDRRQNTLNKSEASLLDEFNDMSRVRRKKDFEYFEMIDGSSINIVKGLELHTGVFNELEQKKIVDYVFELQRLGQEGHLRARTYSQPKKWMRGKGRVTIQFGCCYNYAEDKKGNPPGIIRDEEVDPLPPMFKTMIKRLVRWHVLPPTCVPNSCIVNIYDKDDCIPPHIDHHDFLRPFCTVSFLTESNILFGSSLKIKDAGEFFGPVKIPLPVGSVLVLNGNGANVAKHCVPAVRSRRISITFRKMDDKKMPFKFRHDPELQGLQPLVYSPLMKSPAHQVPHPTLIHQNKRVPNNESEGLLQRANSTYQLGEQDFPPLGGSNSNGRSKPNKNRLH
ncbi:hypothetical protein NE237_016388 [Protea cynaroides]|uniref:Fe2OG dioxygenase domain-containing protein n=1 Tax=Protea cynaroides TaxID=273540 RepID=A0A9Q0HIK4_9MAGN|nr:hypothetical protein NE237_016388 [Protea cynaroides]